jgi:hypothetical protein
MLTAFRNSKGVVLTDFLEKGATKLNTDILKNLKITSQERGQIFMISCFNKTMTGLTQVPPQQTTLHIWGLQCYHNQSTGHFLLLAISTCSPTSRMISGGNFSSDEVKLWYASGLGRKKKTLLQTEFKNLLNNDTNLLKLEEIMWNSEYAQL